MRARKMRVRVDWLTLPEHMLSLISEKLFCNIKDYVRFGAVCRSWRSIYTENRHRLPRQLPMLMIPTEPNNWDSDDEHTRSFYSLTKKRVLNFQAPVAHNLLCRGSCHGWLVIVDRVTTNVNLFNPFISTNNLIHLPSLTALKLDDINDSEGEYELFGYIYDEFDFYRKFVLSANPASNPNYKVMVIFGGNYKLAFFTPGDDDWTILPSMQDVEDIIYYRDRFYVVQKSGQVFAWDLNQVPSTATKIGPPLEPQLDLRRYLVESSGDLLQVILGSEENNKFRVFKLDSIAMKWIEMNNLDGHVLFLGDNGSLSLSASDYPECKPNSVYFTDDHYFEHDFEEEFLPVPGPHDLGIFSLEDRTVEPYYPPEELKLVTPIPIWIEPTL